MIKRSYFMAVKINHLDGALSYSWFYQVATHRSLFEDSSLVFNDMMDKCQQEAKRKGYPAENIEVTCFCRC